MKNSVQTNIMIDLVKSTKIIREVNNISIDEVNDVLGVHQICEAIEANEWHINGKAITGYQVITYLAIIDARLIVYNNSQEEETTNDIHSYNPMADDFLQTLGNIIKPNK